MSGCGDPAINPTFLDYIFRTFLIKLPFIISDCGDPATTYQGYTFGTSTGTTYQSTHEITGCNTGYDGSASMTLTCEASGSWTTPTGCTIKGRSHLFMVTAVHRI